MQVGALEMELHLPQVRSLKAKRALLRPVLEGSRHRFAVAASEVGYHDQWQAARLGFAAVGPSPGHVGQVLDAVERFVWSFPELEVVSACRRWLDEE
jgi:hypothetical protein